MISVLFLLAGFALLILGGEVLVRGAVRLAKRAGVSPLLIGLAIVGFGTSMPELVASVEAALIGAPGIAWGNIAGSNLANTLLILGAASLVAPFALAERGLWRDSAAALGATALLYALAATGWIGIGAGAVLIAILLGYLVLAWFQESKAEAHHGAAFDRAAAKHAEEQYARQSGDGWVVPIALTLTGLALLIAGGGILVSGAVDIARLLGMSETVIGLSIVAIGTSAPELITSTLAALRKQGELAFGNVVGSNIYNLLGIGGVTALAAPGSLPPELLRTEFPLLLASALLLVALVAFGGRFGRLTGALLMGAYIVYLTALIVAAA
ncbi:MAG: calcium/sodium antiporter [Sphingomonadaceae bacterium]|nr:calcium/sodium antiporter [Sphingomonadaceae bacterium]